MEIRRKEGSWKEGRELGQHGLPAYLQRSLQDSWCTVGAE